MRRFKNPSPKTWETIGKVGAGIVVLNIIGSFIPSLNEWKLQQYYKIVNNYRRRNGLPLLVINTRSNNVS